MRRRSPQHHRTKHCDYLCPSSRTDVHRYHECSPALYDATTNVAAYQRARRVWPTLAINLRTEGRRHEIRNAHASGHGQA